VLRIPIILRFQFLVMGEKGCSPDNPMKKPEVGGDPQSMIALKRNHN
jgi:hypothetical protein